MKKTYGIILTLLLSIPSYILGVKFPVIGPPVFAILIGIILANIVGNKEIFQEGIAFTSKKILQYSVILLGFGMNFSQIILSGKSSLPVILSTISISLITAFILSKILKIDYKTATLVGVGSSICGGSAIAATAPVIDADSEEIASSISVIFLFNIIAAIIFPQLGEHLHLTNEGFGLFAGTAINDTSSVTAAAMAWDNSHNSNVLDIATVVKLTRTLAIIPITLCLSIYYSKKEEKTENNFKITKLVPSFILLFLAASIITTVFSIPPQIIGYLKTLSKFMITMAMCSIGLKTNLVSLVKNGGKSILLGFCCWLAIGFTSIGIQNLIGII